MNNKNSIEESGWTTISKVFYVNTVSNPATRQDYLSIVDYFKDSEMVSSVIDPILSKLFNEMNPVKDILLFWVHPKYEDGSELNHTYFFKVNLKGYSSGGYLPFIGIAATLDRDFRARLDVHINYKIVRGEMSRNN